MLDPRLAAARLASACCGGTPTKTDYDPENPKEAARAGEEGMELILTAWTEAAKP